MMGDIVLRQGSAVQEVAVEKETVSTPYKVCCTHFSESGHVRFTSSFAATSCRFCQRNTDGRKKEDIYSTTV